MILTLIIVSQSILTLLGNIHIILLHCHPRIIIDKYSIKCMQQKISSVPAGPEPGQPCQHEKK